MSRTKPNSNTKNPAVATLEWSAMDGVFSMWDNANKVKVMVDGDLKFAVLDQLGCVSGWVKELGSCRSRETHDINATDTRVFAWKDGKSRLIREGAYKEIKDELKAMGIKYHKVVYAMLLTDIDSIRAGSIVRLDLGGAAMSEWIEVGVGDDWGVEIGEPVEVQVNKMIKYMKPTYSKIDLSETEGVMADEADGVLQDYFASKKAQAVAVHEDSPSASYTDADCPEEDEDQIPF